MDFSLGEGRGEMGLELSWDMEKRLKGWLRRIFRILDVVVMSVDVISFIEATITVDELKSNQRKKQEHF